MKKDLISEEYNEFIHTSTDQELIRTRCLNYSDFHIHLSGKRIMDRLSGQEFPKVDFFWNKTYKDKKALLLNQHTNYYVTKKNT